MNKILIALLLASSCSFKKTQTDNQILKGHEELYSEPDAPKLLELAPQEKRIVIASTNDIHGNYRPELVTFKDEHQDGLQNIRIGGVDVINNYFSILRETYKNVVLVDSGDIFSNASSLSAVQEFYSFLKYDALTIGLRDFNIKVPEKIGSTVDLFRKFSSSSEVPLILSNLYDLKTARGVEWKGTKSHHIIDRDGVRIGVIGLIPDDIVAQTPVNNRLGLFVESMIQSTLRHARLLRSLGADVIVVLTHQAMDCSSELSAKSKLPPLKVNFEPERTGVCETKGVMAEYLERLPPHLVDVVIGGRSHKKMANFVNGTLVMSGFPDGRSFNYVELVVDSKQNKLIPSKTVVHQPVYFCHEFFKETKDCFTEDFSVNHKERIPATFLGKPIERDLTLEKRFPGLSTDQASTTSSEGMNVASTLIKHQSDISYIAKHISGDTQLLVLKVKGSELMKVLEEDYNLSRKDLWKPSPFMVKNQELSIFISGNEIIADEYYRVLTDLESLQKHHRLVGFIKLTGHEILSHLSWASGAEADSVSTTMASGIR